MKDHSLNDESYKQLKKMHAKLCPTKTKKTDDRAACSFRSNSCITVCFRLKAGKIIIIINN